MNKVFIAFVGCAIALTACSSKKKTEVAPEPVIEQKATPTAEAIGKIEKKKSQKEKIAPAVTEAAPSESSTPAAGSSFASFEGTEKSTHSCTIKGETRTITVKTGTDGGCGVVYNKANEDRTVAVAKSDMSHCDKVSDKIKSNLEAAGYDCGGGGNAAPATTEAAPAAPEN